MNLDPAIDSELSTEPDPGRASAPSPVGTRLHAAIREGLRAAFLKRPAWHEAGVPPLDLVILLVATSVLQLGLGRLEIRGAANFSLPLWLYQWWPMAALVLLAWICLPRRPGVLSSFIALLSVAGTVQYAAMEGVRIAQVYGLFNSVNAQVWTWLGWAVYLAMLAWYLASVARIGQTLGASRANVTLLLIAVTALQALAAWQSIGAPWRSAARPESSRPELVLSQEVFEEQQALWKRSVEGLAPQRPGKTDVYALVFAPYADEDVFLRESTMVRHLLESRFDAQGRVLQLANNASTTGELPWATPLNLQRGLEAIARTMDKDNDLLVIYMTSHGASNHKLAASHWPLEVDGMTPEKLRSALDAVGIKHRVVAISACYSGGWVEPLASDDTLVMTAADATHTSYGCGSRSDLTFFGRAVFDEQLRITHSFEEAFANAVPVIRTRENEAGKTDGFSNPQISVGGSIKPYLEGLRQHLDADQAKAKAKTPAGS